MRRFLVPLVFAVSMIAGCLGSIGTPGDPGGMPQPGGNPNPNPNSNNPDPTPTPTGGKDGGAVTPTFDLAGPPSPMGTIAVTLASSSESIRLNESKDLTVSLTPGNGFNGMTMFTVAGLPAGVTATFNPPGAMMTAPITTTLTITTASDLTPAAGMPLTVTATSGTIVGQAALTVDVKAELLVTIATGVNVGSSASPNNSAFGGAASIPVLFVAPGTKITWVNGDNINHEIHSDGTLGIQHEGGPLMANGGNSYTQTFNGKGTYDYHCHIHPGMRGQIVVK